MDLELADIEHALRASHGLLSPAAARLSEICGATVTPALLREYIQQHARLQEVVDELAERNLDLAEGKLLLGVSSGNLGAAMYYLRAKGRSRGYGAGGPEDAFASDPDTEIYHGANLIAVVGVTTDGRPLVLIYRRSPPAAIPQHQLTGLLASTLAASLAETISFDPRATHAARIDTLIETATAP